MALGVAAALLVARSARAGDPGEAPIVAPAEPNDSVARPRVEVHLVGALGGVPALAQLLDEWFGTSQIEHTLVSTPKLRLENLSAPRAGGAPIRMWLVPVGEHLVRIVFAEPDAQRYLARDAALPSGLDEVGRERLVQIALSSLQAFIDEPSSTPLEAIEIPSTESKPTPKRSPRPALAPEAPEPRAVLGVGVLYGATAKGEEGTAHGPGASFQLLARIAPFALGGFVQAQYRLPRAAMTERVRLSIQELVSDAGVAAELRVTARWSWCVELGGGVQFVHVAPTARAPDVMAVGAGWDVRPIAFGAFGPALDLGSLRFGLSARLDVQPVGTRYEVAVNGVRQSELVVPRLQPGMVLTVAFRRSIFESRAARSARSLAPSTTDPPNP